MLRPIVPQQAFRRCLIQEQSKVSYHPLVHDANLLTKIGRPSVHETRHSPKYALKHGGEKSHTYPFRQPLDDGHRYISLHSPHQVAHRKKECGSQSLLKRVGEDKDGDRRKATLSGKREKSMESGHNFDVNLRTFLRC